MCPRPGAGHYSWNMHEYTCALVHMRVCTSSTRGHARALACASALLIFFVAVRTLRALQKPDQSQEKENRGDLSSQDAIISRVDMVHPVRTKHLFSFSRLHRNDIDSASISRYIDNIELERPRGIYTFRYG